MSGVAQIDSRGRLCHLLSLEGLGADLIREIFARADEFAAAAKPGAAASSLLSRRLVLNLFFETSTRTRSAFEIAAKRLGADVVNLDSASASARNKGETLADTARTLAAMGGDIMVLRHYQSGAAHFLAAHTPPHLAVINGGDGCNAHPTQGLLDAYTVIRRRGAIDGAVVAIVGDILHSRVARSDMQIFRALGADEIRAIAPRTLLPAGLEEAFGAKAFCNLDDGLRGADIVIVLRMQRERMAGAFFYPGEAAYFRDYGITAARLQSAAKDALVLHPGPINRGVEIAGDLADSSRALVLEQVTNGVAVRMALLAMLAP
jgi:aspartate carbamoyltransferase catalytic subunit